MMGRVKVVEKREEREQGIRLRSEEREDGFL